MGIRMPGSSSAGPNMQAPGQGNMMVRGALGAMQRPMNPQMQAQGQNNDMQQQLKQFEVCSVSIIIATVCFIQSPVILVRCLFYSAH